MDLIARLADTTVPAILALMALFLLLTAIGVRFRVTFDINDVSRRAATIVSVSFFSAAVALWILGSRPIGSVSDPIPQQDQDPFLRYYIFSVVVLVVLFFAVMAYCKGDSQKRAVNGLFSLTGFGASVSVIWRFVVIRRYLNAPETYQIPQGLLHGPYNLFPYFIVMGVGGGMILWLSLHYTRGTTTNSDNRNTLVWYFVALSMYLLLCRALWELVDLQATQSAGLLSS